MLVIKIGSWNSYVKAIQAHITSSFEFSKKNSNFKWNFKLWWLATISFHTTCYKPYVTSSSRGLICNN